MSSNLSPRNRVAILSAVVLVIGGGVGAVFALAYFIAKYYPELNKPGAFDGIWIPVGVIILVICMLLGLILGSVIWLIMMRFLLSRDELKYYFTQPYIPIVTPIFSRLFNILYQED